MQKDIESARMQLWCDVWLAVATSSNTARKTVPTIWADEALSEFDKRFNKNSNEEKTN